MSAAPCRRALWAAAVLAAGAAARGGDEEVAALLQAASPGARRSSGAARAAATREEDEVHVVFTTDCRPFNQWQAELVFLSALHVGQPGPITQIASGCSAEAQRHIEERIASLALPERFSVYFVPEFNDAKSHWLNKPYGVRSWVKSPGPERDVVAVIDPDFIFLRPLTTAITGAQEALHWEGDQRPDKVRKGVVVAQRWWLQRPDGSDTPWLLKWNAPNMTAAETLTYVCSGSPAADSGCTGVTHREIGNYHGVGVPYIAHKDDWDGWLADSWADITERLHPLTSKGFYVDMWSWSLANVHHRTRQFVVSNLGLYDPNDSQEDWRYMDEAAADPCTAPMDMVLADHKAVSPLGHFLHYSQVQTLTAGGWNKYWFDWTRKSGNANAFEHCDRDETYHGFAQVLKERERPHQPPHVRKRVDFAACVAKRMFGAALKRSCPGKPAALVGEKISAGFTF